MMILESLKPLEEACGNVYEAAHNRHQISPVNAQREFCDVAKTVLFIVTRNTFPETSSTVISSDGNATMEASIHESEEVILQAGDQELVKSIAPSEAPNCKPWKLASSWIHGNQSITIVLGWMVQQRHTRILQTLSRFHIA